MKIRHNGKLNRIGRKAQKRRDKLVKGIWPSLPSCGGKCCAAFVLNFGNIRHGDTFWGNEDQAILQRLFYPITREEAIARTGIESVSAASDWWACRAWDPETGLCKEREHRPQLCRAYSCSTCDICRIRYREAHPDAAVMKADTAEPPPTRGGEEKVSAEIAEFLAMAKEYGVLA